MIQTFGERNRVDIVYLQCDARFNQWLMKKINEKYIIEYTIQKAKELNCQKLIAGIYECDENRELINILNQGGIRKIIQRGCECKIFKHCGK